MINRRPRRLILSGACTFVPGTFFGVVSQSRCVSVALCFIRPVTSVGLHLYKADVETEHEGLTCRVER